MTLKEKIYETMDSFLTEAKDQFGNERSLERLNQDRHLFVDKILNLISQDREELAKKIEKMREWGQCNPCFDGKHCKGKNPRCECSCVKNREERINRSKYEKNQILDEVLSLIKPNTPPNAGD